MAHASQCGSRTIDQIFKGGDFDEGVKRATGKMIKMEEDSVLLFEAGDRAFQDEMVEESKQSKRRRVKKTSGQIRCERQVRAVEDVKMALQFHMVMGEQCGRMVGVQRCHQRPVGECISEFPVR